MLDIFYCAARRHNITADGHIQTRRGEAEGAEDKGVPHRVARYALTVVSKDTQVRRHPFAEMSL